MKVQKITRITAYVHVQCTSHARGGTEAGVITVRVDRTVIFRRSAITFAVAMDSDLRLKIRGSCERRAKKD